MKPEQRRRHLRLLIRVVDGLRLAVGEPVRRHRRVIVTRRRDETAVQVGPQQIVDRALQSPLGAGGRFAAYQLAGVLDDVHLAEHRLNDRLALP